MADDTAPETDAPADDGDAAEDQAAEVEQVHGVPVTHSRGQRVLHPTRDQLLDVVRALCDDGFTMLLDVAGVDYLTYGAPRDLPAGLEPERFEVVVVLISHQRRERVRLRVQIPESDPTCPSLFAVHPGAEASEREAFDMFGIRFEGHPDLTRILMPEDWVGHPLRKDHPVGAIPVQFKAAPGAR